MSIKNNIMILATIPHPPPTITPPLYHLSPPQNHHLPSENHHPQITTSSQHTSNQSIVPMEKLSFLIQKMQENHVQHQQQMTNLLQSIIPSISIAQPSHCSVQEKGDAALYSSVSAENGSLGQFHSHSNAQQATHVENQQAHVISVIQPSPHPINISHKSSEQAPSLTDAQNKFSYLETPFSALNSCIPEPQNHHLSPTVFTQQNCLLHTGPNVLTTQGYMTETVQSLPLFSACPVAADIAQGSRLDLVQSHTPFSSSQDSHPVLSATQLNIPVDSQPASTAPTCNTSASQHEVLVTRSPAIVTSSVPSQPSSKHPSFASLLQQNNGATPIPLAPLPTPYLKGNLPAIKLDEQIYQKSALACELNLIGRLTLPKGSSPITAFDLHAKLSSRWKLQSPFILTPIGKGFFCLRFKHKKDQNSALLNGHLNLSPGSFRLQPWVKDFNPHFQKNTTANVWIRLHDVAQDYWDPHLLISIASLVGIPQAFDKNTLHLTFGHYARLKVEVDLLQQQPARLLVEREGYSFEVPVTYENLPSFCAHCLSIGHLVGECRTLRKVQEDASRFKDAAPKVHQKNQKLAAHNVVKNHGQSHATTSAHAEKISQQAAMPQIPAHTTAVPPILNIVSQNHGQSHSQNALPIAQSTGNLANNQSIQKSIMPNQNCSSEPTDSDFSANTNHQNTSHSVESFVPCSMENLTHADNNHSSKNTTETFVLCSKSSKKKNKFSLKQPMHHNTSYYIQNNPTPSHRSFSNISFKQRHHNQFDPLSNWEGDGDGEMWNIFEESEDDKAATATFNDDLYHGSTPSNCSNWLGPNLNLSESLDWGNMAEDDPLPSWESKADEAFEAAINGDNTKLCCLLGEDIQSSVLDQHFPPLQTSSQNTKASSSGTEYVPSPVKTRAQRQKSGAAALPLHKQKKQSKAAKREANAKSRVSKNMNTHKTYDPDEVQWQLLLADQNKREEEATAISAVAKVTSVAQPHSAIVPQLEREDKQWKVCVYSRKKQEEKTANQKPLEDETV